jgi:cellobiose-specific phosphotransferase system component IIB
MTVIFVSTGVSTGLMVDKMMKVAPGGLVVPLLPKQTQLQVQNPRLDVDFGVFIALRDKKKKSKIPLWISTEKIGAGLWPA